ncbi:MAG: hypothetical protein COT34_02015 [Candidatus Nealsonbacteria bacterium CG08_land_8_20_14_0_20_43_11]|uniref:ABC3 transporter permease C-terminal domain-containing protein n=1 Tax=Candidatus Nealsonbacteria bacterium CG08_land_8_20_14_0_20_43_11 TaxID=1974706 RepID=A0A2M6T0X2_9BACT|nr:MAG: hypothetical protein COT34_02015 [Candidatus Nealsonbacteria bacterium CG08_land_8_20_14_0_20_43_11]
MPAPKLVLERHSKVWKALIQWQKARCVKRTKEIGVLKAVGAENSTIALIFLMEAGIIGLIGGIGGVIMGIGFAKLVETIVRLSNISLVRASVSPFLVLFGLTFSFSVGCLSGFLPARKASQLKPVEALRYE